MNASIELIVELIDRSYDKPAWHGPNLRSLLKGITAEEAAWRPGMNRHNIWEITLHAAYWKYVTRRRLLNEKRGSFPLKGSNFFVRPTSEFLSEKDWQGDLELLAVTHAALRDAVVHIKSADLHKKLRGGRWTLYQMLSGIASHDVYHAGQIGLLKRMRRDRR